MFIYNALGKVAETNLRRWTKTTKECYKNGMNCNICTIPDDFKKKCRRNIKPCVLELVKKFGAPENDIATIQ